MSNPIRECVDATPKYEKSRKFPRAVGLAAVSSLLLTACSGGGGGGDDAEAVSEGGHATVGVDSPFVGFDPNVTPAAQDARVIRQVFDNLLYMDEDQELQPWLATDWEVSDDGLEYTFNVRDDVTFHDGTNFDASAVCFNLDRIADPAMASQYAAGLIGTYASCEVSDEYTAVVTMSEPFSPFLNNLTSPFLGLNSPTAAEGEERDDYTVAPVGTGPFQIDSYTPDDRVELSRYEDYDWGPDNAEHTGPALLESVTFQIIPDTTVRLGSLNSGEVQAIYGVAEEEVDSVQDNPDLQYHGAIQSGSPYLLHFNTEEGVFEDETVRKAAQSALDIDSAVEALFMGHRERAWAPIGPTTVDYDESFEGSIDFDPEEAAGLLEEAGWEEGSDGVRTKDGERLSISYIESSPNRGKRQDLAAFFESNLQEVGFEVDVSFQQVAQITPMYQEGDYDIGGLSLVSVDPDVMYQLYHSEFVPEQGASRFNFSRTADDTLDTMLEDVRTSTDLDERSEMVADVVEETIAEQARSVPIYVPEFTLAFNGLGGVRYDLEGYPVYYDAHLTE